MKPLQDKSNLRYGIYAGLLSVLTLVAAYFVRPSLAVHPYTQQSVWVWYLICMWLAIKNTQLRMPQEHWLVLLRSSFVVFLIANAFFYATYYLLHQIDPNLLTAQRQVMIDLYVPSLPQEDQAKARFEMMQSDFSSLGTVVFNYARAAIGGFLVSGVLAFLIYRLSPVDHDAQNAH